MGRGPYELGTACYRKYIKELLLMWRVLQAMLEELLRYFHDNEWNAAMIDSLDVTLIEDVSAAYIVNDIEMPVIINT